MVGVGIGSGGKSTGGGSGGGCSSNGGGEGSGGGTVGGTTGSGTGTELSSVDDDGFLIGTNKVMLTAAGFAGASRGDSGSTMRGGGSLRIGFLGSI